MEFERGVRLTKIADQQQTDTEMHTFLELHQQKTC